jgi:coenzyme F420-0:L-glutamate ligase / coenzyme F420-1:gamma-L-glutamate ligase
MTLSVVPLTGLPLVERGDDLAELILVALARAEIELVTSDVVVVTGKIVSKAEGRAVALVTVEPSRRAVKLALATDKDPRLVELVLQESAEVIRARPGVLLVRHRLGYVSAMAGIDRSNVADDDEIALLLPEDPDRSAAGLRAVPAAATGVAPAVVITDSHGRAFRKGNTGVAIGASGIEAMRVLEGEPDLFGRPLTAASVVPVADLVASTAMLVSGEGNEGVPVVVVRGLGFRDAASSGPGVGAAPLIRPPGEDFFAQPDAEY